MLALRAALFGVTVTSGYDRSHYKTEHGFSTINDESTVVCPIPLFSCKKSKGPDQHIQKPSIRPLLI